ncbi:hypothetical protein FIBSPDRAFT_858412 [Athelia psychrophila]|uniref:Uncharacterized protein n=1 Tax=Athelia psychrophila TaxID=1759441 RepID=A0A166LYI0_9AGAM|nr:hypothetical protein FIBSPDRAFT_858412 [Fibularhizoctonia sp. CBS 109695]
MRVVSHSPVLNRKADRDTGASQGFNASTFNVQRSSSRLLSAPSATLPTANSHVLFDPAH